MSFNSIYVNGSSFSCGNGLDLIEIKKIYKEKLNIEIQNHIDFSYPNMIASNFKTKIMKAYVFPGQGAQYPGMGKDLYENSAEAKALFEKANEILGFDITKIMFEGTVDDLKETKVTFF